MRSSFVVLLLFLSACSINQSRSPQQANVTPKAYLDNVRYVRKLTDWQITGAIAAKYAEQGWQARMTWHEQARQTFSGRLYAYLTPEQINIKGSPAGVVLTDQKGRQYRERSIESMIKQSTGWQIPMDRLRFWVRGMPAPFAAYRTTFDNEARIKTLRQSGWLITYKNYLHMGGYVLPKKIELVKGPLRLRLVISKWVI